MRKTSGRSALALLSILALALAACNRTGAAEGLPEDTAPPAPTQDPFTVSLTQSFVETEQAILAGVAGGEESIAETESAPVTGGEGELQPEEPVGEQPTPIPDVSIPEPTPIPVVPGLPTVYVVQPGDWIWQIARNFGVDPRAIIEANPGINPDLVQPGQELNIPAPTADNTGGGAGDVPTGGTTYTVSAGENLFRISLGFGLNYIDVAAANAIVSPYLVYPGQVLTIP